jgi:hypothetical protein
MLSIRAYCWSLIQHSQATAHAADRTTSHGTHRTHVVALPVAWRCVNVQDGVGDSLRAMSVRARKLCLLVQSAAGREWVEGGEMHPVWRTTL